MRFPSLRPRAPRRGVTLVEMLVSVALLVLMMTVIVQIFTAATGAVTAAKAFQELDGSLRELDSTIRQDLTFSTAKMTPPLDPDANLGYFEYNENQFADSQGEDTDDILRFTTQAPLGQFFTGRFWPVSANQNTTAPVNQPVSALNQPIMIQSQYAEIIYFLRNGNLYRRVLLVAPELQNTIWNVSGTYFQPGMVNPTATANYTSWQGMNDVSARPSTSSLYAKTPIVLNTLGDLTNRENRFAYPRFANDYDGDGIADDYNTPNGTTLTGDGVHDYYPTLYPDVFGASPALTFEVGPYPKRIHTYQTMPFPYVFPGAYSKPDAATGAATGAGWIHSTDPSTTFTSFLNQLLSLNHAPLDAGDSLPFPGSTQTWWGLPTWRETMSTNWTDPTIVVASSAAQPLFLSPVPPNTVPPVFAATDALPPMTAQYRNVGQLNTDGAGSASLAPNTTPTALWNVLWEDDLILTNVRSFDVKAYDNSFPGYVDLGWGDDLRLYQPYSGTAYTPPTTPPLLAPASANTPTLTLPIPFAWPPTGGTTAYDMYGQTFAHEGRMPPLTGDYRFDSQTPNYAYPNAPYPGFPNYFGNVGDDQKTVIRLRRVWDTWSTEYSQAPANGYNPINQLPVGPSNSPPIFPSYPPPYPAALRGIQIQIRVADPRNERIKVLTIRQDFANKL